MSDPQELEQFAKKFYTAFQSRDLDTLESMYAENACFQDAAFTLESREKIMKMWRTLFRPESKAVVTFEFVRIENNIAHVHWEAKYALIKGRPVHNKIDAQLTIENGKVVRHMDFFDWNIWARQAFPIGPLCHLFVVKALINKLIVKKVMG